MKIISFLMALAIIAAVVYFVFLKKPENTVPADSATAATANDGKHKPTTVYGKALHYSRTTVENASSEHNQAVEDALNAK